MKPLLRLLIIFSFLASTAITVQASDLGPPGELDPTVSYYQVFLPANFVGARSYTISGKVMDAQSNPLPGAVVTDNNGHSVSTDINGNYALTVNPGQYALAPEKEGFSFAPSMTDVNVSTSNITGQNFTAQAACMEGTTNSSFESNTWWTFPSSARPAVYSTDIKHTGARAVRTGILSTLDNIYSYSSVRSPVISIPAGSSSVTMRMWLYPISGEATSAPLPAPPENPTAETAVAAYDAQYVLVLDTADNLLETLVWMRSNSQAWGYHEFDLSKWSGHSIKIQVGTYNDGSAGVTAMYVDDLTMEICSGTVPPPPPPPPACTNQLSNSGFEYNTAWGIPITAYPAAYSYDYAYAGVRSMRMGVPLWTTTNPYSYSDAWQTVSIPSTATSAYLHVKLYPRSEEPPPAAPDDPSLAPPQAGAEWAQAPLASDTQYILVLNPTTGAIIETLQWWVNKNSSGWISKSYDLTKYKGQSIRIQVGAYNDGIGGRSVMYMDEAYVDTCATTPPPPPVCTNLVLNGGFESTSAWYIPSTQFSAGYSTYLWRTGLRSMRTGIVYLVHNRYSYSDFRQTVAIPYGVSSATLNMYLYSMSGESTLAPLPASPTSGNLPQEAMSGDVQYLLVLDRWGNWIDTLVWQRSNESFWHQFQFNLLKYAGETIMLQWGTYNNGWGGVTSMYVDDVSLNACP